MMNTRAECLNRIGNVPVMSRQASCCQAECWLTMLQRASFLLAPNLHSLSDQFEKGLASFFWMLPAMTHMSLQSVIKDRVAKSCIRDACCSCEEASPMDIIVCSDTVDESWKRSDQGFANRSISNKFILSGLRRGFTDHRQCPPVSHWGCWCQMLSQ